MVRLGVIATIKHRGLKKLYQTGDATGLSPSQVHRLEDVLGHLDAATTPADLDLPGYRLHPLKGNLKGFWSITITGNWRVIFRMSDGEVSEVDLVDYH